MKSALRLDLQDLIRTDLLYPLHSVLDAVPEDLLQAV
jgi:hypothetical protein